MRILLLILTVIITFSGCHRKELPSTQLRKEMRAANQKSIKAGKKQLKKNKQSLGKKKR